MKLWLCLVPVILFAQTAWAQPPEDSPDVPLTNSAYTDLITIYNSTFVECMYGYTGKLRPMSRYEFGVVIARFIQILPQTKQTLPISFINKNRHVYSALARLLVQFTPELRSLGISDSYLNSTYPLLMGEVGSREDSVVSLPFSDVAPAHWAFNAVEQLRLKGIVTGVKQPDKP